MPDCVSNDGIMSHWARPGVRCICIDGRPHRVSLADGQPTIEFGGVYPVTGEVYTITWIGWHESPIPLLVPSFLGVHLLEINRPPGKLSGTVVPFRVDRFRPLLTRTQEQDIALFAPLLDCTRQSEDA